MEPLKCFKELQEDFVELTRVCDAKSVKIQEFEAKVSKLKDDNNEYEASHIAVFEHNKELKAKIKELEIVGLARLELQTLTQCENTLLELGSNYLLTYPLHMAITLKSDGIEKFTQKETLDPETKVSIERGMEDVKEGKVKPLEDIEKEGSNGQGTR